MTDPRLRPSKSAPLPKITISADEFGILSNLADAATGEMERVGDLLFQELMRAKIVPPHKLEAGIVRLGSYVSYVLGSAAERCVQVVLPQQADIAQSRISVLTPIGAALIGLSAEQSIEFDATNGRRQRLQVISVTQEATS